MAEVEKKKKRTFCKFPSHGIDLRPLLDLSYEQPVQLYSAPQQQGLNRGLRREQHSRLKRLCEAKKEALPLEEPEVVKTHLRDMIVLPEMEAAYNDKTFTQVEIKPELIGHYLGECSITYKPARHRRLVSGPTPPASFPSSSLLGN